MSGDALFVYGSLRSDAGGPMHAELAAGARRLGPARVRGRLFAIDWYPGAVLGDDDAWVHGELWMIEDGRLLVTLDAYEGCDDEFVRRRVLVHAEDGSTRVAWIYAYARPTEGLAVVESGDWLLNPGCAEASRRTR